MRKHEDDDDRCDHDERDDQHSWPVRARSRVMPFEFVDRQIGCVFSPGSVAHVWIVLPDAPCGWVVSQGLIWESLKAIFIDRWLRLWRTSARRRPRHPD